MYLFLVEQKYIFSISFFFIAFMTFAQKQDSVKVSKPLLATASLNVNNNGISLFPNFSLGKPAAIVNFSVGKKHFFFEPELRWGLNGKPWSYIYWLRFKTIKKNNFTFQTGLHSSFVFRDTPLIINNKNQNRWISQRYLAGEFMPVWYKSSKFSLALYMLTSKGLDSYAIQNSYFVSLQPRFPKINLNKSYYLSFFPQVFYLKLDKTQGTYVSETLNLSKEKFPLGISSIFTYKLNATIAGENVVWNVGLNYKF